MKLAEAIKKAKRVYICGNGGSAANASHIANDLLLCGIKAHALTDVATLTALGNDFGYEHVFAKQIRVYGEPGDLLICLSGSGKSQNIVNALDAAKDIGMASWTLTGAYHDGFPVKELSDHCTQFGSDMQDAEQRQVYQGHVAMRAIRGT